MKLLLFCFLALSAAAQPGPHDPWKKLFNTHIDSISKVYTSDAVLVTTEGIVHATAKARSAFYAQLKKDIGEIKSITIISQEEVMPGMRFEIGSFISGNQKKFMQLLITRKVNNKWMRELEILNEANADPADLTSINGARDAWMKLCNSHRANELVSNAYTANAVYYNNHRVLTGTSAIAAEYRYMNNPSYTLTLTPIVVEAAGNNVAFEIGQCSGSYAGKYMLVWKKTANNWKVLFDSN